MQPREVLLEHTTLIGNLLYTTLFTLSFQLSGILSSYIYAVASIANFSALLVNDLFSLGAPSSLDRPISLFALSIGQILPLIFGVDGLLGILDLFVPLTGRMGPDVPVDFVMASIIGFFTIGMTPMLLPLAHRIGRRALMRVLVALLAIQAIALAVFCNPAWPTYDAMHPKRLFALQCVP